MIVTKSQLRKIIQEEITKAMSEGRFSTLEDYQSQIAGSIIVDLQEKGISKMELTDKQIEAAIKNHIDNHTHNEKMVAGLLASVDAVRGFVIDRGRQ